VRKRSQSGRAIRSTRFNFLPRTLWSCLFLLLAAMAVPRAASGQTIDWVRRVGTLGLDEALGVAVDASGVYVVGYTSGALPGLDQVGGQDAYIRKYDLSGNVLWTRQFGTVFDDQARGVAVDASGVYVVGVQGASLADRTDLNNYDGFVRKYDSAGNLLWDRTIASVGTLQNDYANAVAVDASGAVYVAGTTAGTLAGQLPQGSFDGFVRKYDSSGAEQWTRQFGVKTQDFVVGVATNASGVFAFGETDAALPGQTFAGGVYDVFLKAFDASGNEQWTREFGTPGFDFPGGVTADASGVYVAGATAGTPGQTASAGYSAFVRKYDNTGAELWTRQFGSTGDALAYGVAVTAAGVYVAGNVIGTLPGQAGAGGLNEDQFVRKYDLQGNALWTRQFGTPERDWTNGVAANSSGVYVAGDSPRTLLSSTTTGDLDGVLTKLIEAPLVIPTINAGGVVNAASLSPQASVAAGSLASLFGTNLVPAPEDRVLVQMNGISAPVFAVTPTQVNFQVPWELAGLTRATLTVTVGAATSSAVNVPLSPAAPGIFSTNASGSGQGAVLIANSSSIAAATGTFPGSRPAIRPIVQGTTTKQVPDGIISIYCTGLGAVTNQPSTGVAASGSPLSSDPVRPTVSIGGVNAAVIFSGLAPGYIGLYQVDAIIQPGTPTGDGVSVQITINGVGSNVVTIAVQ
jgi:uncharacterized protein (TIGR03437 family)